MLKSKLPTTKALLQPKIPGNVREKLQQRSLKQKKYYDSTAKPLKPATMYQLTQSRRDKGWEPAVLTGMHQAPRSFIETTPEGGVYRRNRRHLLLSAEPPPDVLGAD